MRHALIAILSLAATSAAGDFLLSPPIACDLGDTCYIQQFVDHDPSAAASDFTCGSLTYDGHKGTDFALPSLAMQMAGVNVIASVAGRVTGVRDEMPDILQGSPNAPDVSDRECGNGVVVAHDDGWETQYCHLALGSVSVIAGQQVAVGDVLGRGGLSGATQFPHVHLSVRRNGAVVDPFDPDGRIICGEADSQTLWETPLAVPAGGIISAGFATNVPDYTAIKAGIVPAPAGTTDPALVLWGYMFGSRAGDTFSVTITGPAGIVFEQSGTLDRTQAQLFRAGGKRTPPGGWPAGTYVGDFRMMRDGQLIDSASATVTLTP